MLNQVTIVTVTYNSAAVIGGCLASLAPGCRVVVVDNASTDGTAAIARQYPVTVLEQTNNLGFGTACNLGARGSDTPFILFLNPDARLSAGTAEALVAAAERHPDAAAFNPDIVGDDGLLVERASSRFLTPSGRRLKPAVGGDREVDVLSGAALFCRRSAFTEVDGFDERIFLFFEDDDLCLRLRTAGHRLLRVDSPPVTHSQGQSSPAAPALTYFKNYHWMRSFRHVSRKHGVPFPALRICLREGWQLALAALRGDTDRSARCRGRIDGALDRPLQR